MSETGVGVRQRAGGDSLSEDRKGPVSTRMARTGKFPQNGGPRALTARGGVIGTTPPRQTLPEALAVGVNPRIRPGGISGVGGWGGGQGGWKRDRWLFYFLVP